MIFFLPACICSARELPCAGSLQEAWNVNVGADGVDVEVETLSRHCISLRRRWLVHTPPDRPNLVKSVRQGVHAL
jgi:hypothetical protein